MISPPLKWFGGKAYLANWIVSLMPFRCRNPNKPAPDDSGYLHYVEPYAGGLSVLLANDPEGISEVVNDIHLGLTNFWKVLQDKRAFEEFREKVEAIPFSYVEWSDAEVENPAPRVHPNVEAALAFFVQCRQSLSGRMKGFTGITRTRTRRGMNNEVSAWLSCVEGLPAVHARLKRVLILSDQAMNVIRREDGERTLFYLDPPYLHETRAAKDVYQHEMTLDQHAELLTALTDIKGRFLLSGYRSNLYDGYALGCHWARHEKEIANHAAGGDEKRRMTECVWTNF